MATTDAQIDQFNRLVDDWNSRCSRYRYREDSMQAVQRDLDAQKDRLWREGRDLAADGALPPSGSESAPLPTEDDRLSYPRRDAAPIAAPAAPTTDGDRLLSPVTSLVDTREVQSRLAALGYYAARIDGIWGPGSRRAC